MTGFILSMLVKHVQEYDRGSRHHSDEINLFCSSSLGESQSPKNHN